MKKIITMLFLAFCSVILISGCSSNNSDPTLSGTAATGKGIVGTVIVKDANGVEVNVVSDPNGSYTAQVPNMTAPFIIQIIPDDGSPVLFSFATAAGQTVNITPLTNQAMSIASGNGDLVAIYAAWDGSGITETQINNAEAVLRANLSSQITAAGLDPATLDLFNDTFDADGTGIDGVLDILTFSTDGNGVINFVDDNDSGFSFNPNIDITDFIGGGSAGTGGGTLGANETAATVPAEVAGTYTYTFNAPPQGAVAGSPYNAGDVVEFIVSVDGSLTIGGAQVLSAPVFRGGNGFEAIWKDAAKNLEYALSALPTTSNGQSFAANIREVNVGGSNGSPFYGQFRDAAATVTTTPFVCPDTAGHINVSGNIATNAITGPILCPSSSSIAGVTRVTFSDAGGPDFTAHPGATLSIFASNGFEAGGSTAFMVTYTVGGNVWEIDVASGVLSNSGVAVDAAARTIKFSATSVTIVPARVLNPGGATGQIQLTGTVSY